MNFPDGIDILLYSIFTMSLDFLKIHKKQKTEKQKFTIKENVMSEQVKMPVRHFLRRDYLHILFYITFLGFVSLIHQIRIFAKIIPISKAAIPPNTSAITCCFINNVDANIPSDIRIVATR